MKSTIIKNELLSIVKMDESMSFDVYMNSQDEDNRRFVPDEVFESEEEAKEVIEFIMQQYDSVDGPFIYAVIRNSDNANLGYVQLVKIDEGWEIGYHVAKKYTGNGYATEAVKLFLSYLKDNKSLKEIYGIALSDNVASKHVLAKCGFEPLFEGMGIYQGKERKIIRTIKRL